MRRATIDINQSALTHNLQQVKHRAPHSKILAMVKANAYGHGIENILPALDKADALGVACFEEARQLRRLGWRKSLVIIEGVFSEAEWHDSLNNDCQNLIHHLPQVSWAIDHLPHINSPSRTLWLKLNSGMNRLGFEPDTIIAVAKRLHDAGYKLILTSHFANADDANHTLNSEQIHTFNSVLKQLHREVSPSIKASLCNSAAIFNFPECHYDWVRPGIMLYGSSPLKNKTAKHLNLKAVMRLRATLMAIHHISAGTSIGYGSLYVTDKPTRKGIVSVGYGDGYPRVVNESAWVSVEVDTKKVKCPIIGRVAMDMIAIDLSQVPEAQINSRITLWGEIDDSEPSVDEIAASANTIGYELMCRMTPRALRQIS